MKRMIVGIVIGVALCAGVKLVQPVQADSITANAIDSLTAEIRGVRQELASIRRSCR